jgi:RHH-type proline utilization regulon transcriptional repressor/proline dehydrogenase/delta 1-pyrroline-5-carboxylate dehydrogenase
MRDRDKANRYLNPEEEQRSMSPPKLAEPEAYVSPSLQKPYAKNSMATPDQGKIETRTHEIGQQIFGASRMSMFGKNYWYTKMMELATSDPRVKTQLFRFVDVLPVLQTAEQKRDHLLEYLSPAGKTGPWPLSLRLISSLVSLPGLDRAMVSLADFQVKQMAKNFIVGNSLEESLTKLLKARERKIAFTLDILGESAFSHDEAQYYFDKYMSLIEGLGKESKNWPRISPIDHSSLGPIPSVNISVKISALDCRMDAAAFESSLERLIKRLEPLMELAMQNDVFINFDMEQFALKDLTRELFKRLILMPKFKNYRFFGVVVQAYLKSAHADVEDWVAIAKERGTPFSIRLVKGAYWDYETIIADQNGWDVPVYSQKSESDENYETCTRTLLNAFPHIELAVGSHNIRSISHALAYAEALGLPENSLEIQMLYGMADPFKETLVKRNVRIREYAPVGEMLPGLSYLVRRLLENSANDSFLKQSFMDKTGVHELLKAPQKNNR